MATDELESSGATLYLKDALTLMLETRPDNPIAFLASYFRCAASGGDALVMAFRTIKVSSSQRSADRDAIYTAFCSLARPVGRERHGEVVGRDFQALLRLLLCDVPEEAADLLMPIVQWHGEAVRFPHFVMAIQACLQADEITRIAKGVSTDLGRVSSANLVSGVASAEAVEAVDIARLQHQVSVLPEEFPNVSAGVSAVLRLLMDG
mmetsp:Transcript_112584/g.257879  ORF Transcript_112584/g.257879 Transcript_112584/m.257879 type:complete len:207 (+) Transcript_112584:54-674(+)